MDDGACSQIRYECACACVCVRERSSVRVRVRARTRACASLNQIKPSKPDWLPTYLPTYLLDFTSRSIELDPVFPGRM